MRNRNPLRVLQVFHNGQPFSPPVVSNHFLLDVRSAKVCQHTIRVSLGVKLYADDLWRPPNGHHGSFQVNVGADFFQG